MVICPSIGQQLLYLIYSNYRNSGRSETYQSIQVRGTVRSQSVFGNMDIDQWWIGKVTVSIKITPFPKRNKSRLWFDYDDYHKQTLQLMVNISWKPKQNRKCVFILDQSVWNLLCIFSAAPQAKHGREAISSVWT